MKMKGINLIICAVLISAILLAGCNAGAPPKTVAQAVFQKVDAPSTVEVTVKGTPAKAYSERGEPSEFQQSVDVIDTSTNRVIKSVPLKGDGTVSIDLPAGNYRIQAQDNIDGNVQLWIKVNPK